MDAVGSRDGALEFLAAGAIAMVHLSRLAEELVLWSTSEFGFIELADAYSTGSSLMPQKKNPDVPELVRGKAGRAIGNLVALLTVLKGLPLTYNRDLQEDKEPVFDTARTLRDCLEVTRRARSRRCASNRDAMRRAAEDPLLLATDLAEVLVREGVPFREAHEVVGQAGAPLRVEAPRSAYSLGGGPAGLPSRVPGRGRGARRVWSARSRPATASGGPARRRVLAALEATEARLRAEDAALAALEGATES